jgi:hypothetical protein
MKRPLFLLLHGLLLAISMIFVVAAIPMIGSIDLPIVLLLLSWWPFASIGAQDLASMVHLPRNQKPNEVGVVFVKSFSMVGGSFDKMFSHCWIYDG